MPIGDRFRRALGRSTTDSSINSSQSSSTSNLASSTSDPTSTAAYSSSPPKLALTKTSSSLLSRTLTFRSTDREQRKAQKALEQWEKNDKREWKQPTTRYPRKKSQMHQDILRGFEWRNGRKSRDWEPKRSSSFSTWSGISPGASRAASRAASLAEPNGLERITSTNGSIGSRKDSLRRSSLGPLSPSGGRAEGGRPVATVVEE